jgi:hypothetical protein
VDKLLGKSEQRSSAPSKLVARRRARFLRVSLQQDGKRNPRPVKVKVTSYRTLLQSNSSPDLNSIDKSSTPCYPTELDSSSEVSRASTSVSHNTTSPEARPTSPSFDSPWSAYISEVVVTESHDAATARRDSTVLCPSRMFSILEALPHRDSISSSLLSDWLSLIDRRLSFSTLTSSRQSASKVSLADTDISYTECKAADVLVGLSNTVNQANRVLIEECCIKNEDCRHRLISSLSTELLNDPAGSHVQDSVARLTTSLIVQSPGDSYGNNELFFAARVGVAPDVILSLLAVTQNVNAVNADGQTFLFFLNLRFFQSEGPPCRCPGIDGHATRFECLVRALDRRQYDFDHLDNYGRNFLSLMSSSDHFDANWVADLMSRDTTWRYRVECMSQARDAHGNFLLDFLSLHPARTYFARSAHVFPYRSLIFGAMKTGKAGLVCIKECWKGHISRRTQRWSSGSD